MTQASQCEGHFRWMSHENTWESLVPLHWCCLAQQFWGAKEPPSVPFLSPFISTKQTFSQPLLVTHARYLSHKVRSEPRHNYHLLKFPGGLMWCVLSPLIKCNLTSTLMCSKMRIDNLEINHLLSHICFVIYHEPSLLFSTSFIRYLLRILNFIMLNFIWMIYFYRLLYRCEFDYV